MKYKRITLRIPQTLHKNLLDLSSEKSKFMNSEIINRFKKSLTIDNEPISLESIREEFLNKEDRNT